MQAFEVFFQKKLKKHNVFFINTTKSANLADFVVLFSEVPYFLELKNHKKFTISKLKKNQLVLYEKTPYYIVVACNETSKFKNLTLFYRDFGVKKTTIDKFIKKFDKK